MNAWPFVIAAYALVGLGTAGLLGWSALALRRAERKLEALERR